MTENQNTKCLMLRIRMLGSIEMILRILRIHLDDERFYRREI